MLDREVHMGKDLLFHFKAHGRHLRQPFRWHRRSVVYSPE